MESDIKQQHSLALALDLKSKPHISCIHTYIHTYTHIYVSKDCDTITLRFNNDHMYTQIFSNKKHVHITFVSVTHTHTRTHIQISIEQYSEFFLSFCWLFCLMVYQPFSSHLLANYISNNSIHDLELYIYIYVYIYHHHHCRRASNTDIPDPLSPLLPIVYLFIFIIRSS